MMGEWMMRRVRQENLRIEERKKLSRESPRGKLGVYGSLGDTLPGSREGTWSEMEDAPACPKWDLQIPGSAICGFLRFGDCQYGVSASTSEANNKYRNYRRRPELWSALRKGRLK